MGILTRFKDIMSANINALLDKCEDPEKMIDQHLRNLRADLADVKKETAAVMADEKRAKREVDETKAEIAKYTSAAEKAIMKGAEDDARQLLAKKQRLEANLESLNQTYELSKTNADKMKQMHDKLVNDINILEDKKDAIKAKISAAKAQQHVNKVVSGTKSSESSLSAFERMEAKADKMLDSAMAEAELNSKVDESSDLLDKYSSATADSSSVDDELAALKAKLMGGQQ